MSMTVVLTTFCQDVQLAGQHTGHHLVLLGAGVVPGLSVPKYYDTYYYKVLQIRVTDCLRELTKYTAVQDSHKESNADAITRHQDSINVFRAQVRRRAFAIFHRT